MFLFFIFLPWTYIGRSLLLSVEGSVGLKVGSELAG